MSVATLQPPAAIYREEQNFGWWLYALLLGMMALALAFLAWDGAPAGGKAAHRGRWGLEVPVGLFVGMALPAVMIVGVLRMTTEVTPTDVRVWFGWVPTYRHAVALGTIRRIEVVTYRPIRDYLGWGVRRGPDGERVLNARGNRGVRLSLADGSRLLIGSQRPEDLARALERAMQPEA